MDACIVAEATTADRYAEHEGFHRDHPDSCDRPTSAAKAISTFRTDFFALAPPHILSATCALPISFVFINADLARSVDSDA
jgi:hypothetical protein